jgi:hypothetical protein
MPDQKVEPELQKADDARRHLSEDVRELARAAHVARNKSRVVCYVGLGLVVATAVTVFAAGTVALFRRAPRKPDNTQPLWAAIGRKALLAAAGPLAAHLTRRWLLAFPTTAPRRDSSMDASEAPVNRRSQPTNESF